MVSKTILFNRNETETLYASLTGYFASFVNTYFGTIVGVDIFSSKSLFLRGFFSVVAFLLKVDDAPFTRR